MVQSSFKTKNNNTNICKNLSRTGNLVFGGDVVVLGKHMTTTTYVFLFVIYYIRFLILLKLYFDMPFHVCSCKACLYITLCYD